MTRVPALLASLAAAGLLLTSCSALEGPDTPAPASGAPAGLQHVTVSVLPTSDNVALFLGIKEGLFAKEGLALDLVFAKSGADSVGKLTSKEVQIAYSSYTPFFTAQEKLGSQMPIKLIADATANKLGYTMVCAMPNSSVQSVRDMAGKRVAVSALGTMSHLAVAAILRDNGIDYSPTAMHWVELPFPAMAEALRANQVDAAYLVEPYVDQAATSKEPGTAAVRVFDASSSTLDMPLTGFGALAETVDKQRPMITKFQRAIVASTHAAAEGDLAPLWGTLAEFTKIDLDTAKRAQLPAFQTSLEPSRIQRVVRLMRDFGFLKNDLDVRTMIVAPPVT